MVLNTQKVYQAVATIYHLTIQKRVVETTNRGTI